MTITSVRRHVADKYAVYALISKLMYVVAFVLLARGFAFAAIIILAATIFVDSMTDGFVVHTILRSRTRLKGWRILAYIVFGGKEGMTQFLRERALNYAKRGGNLFHWERRFGYLVSAFTRIGHVPLGKGRLVDYLPHDQDSLHAA